MTTKETLLELVEVNKAYGTLQANADVNLRIDSGEIHALLGENGAGKSTLVKIIFGVQQADSGTMLWRGKPVQVTSPAQARELGIGVVFQHFSLFRALSVAENIALGLPSMPPLELSDRIRQTSAKYGFTLDPDRPLYSLSVGEWQRVEIVRCLLGEPRLLILDEPTSVLTPQEAEQLFQTLRQLAAANCAVLYISHRLAELKELCHKATVMRAGRVVAQCDPAVETPATLAQMMIGYKPEPPTRPLVHAPGAHADCLVINDLNLPKTGPFGTNLVNVNLKVPAGNILAIAGIAGNGQQELGEVLAGEQLVPATTITFAGTAIGDQSPGARRRLKIHFVPEERNGHGAVPGMTLWENANITARASQGLIWRGLLRRQSARNFCDRIVASFDVRCSGVDANAASLSGGNLQKFIIGREIIQQPRLLIVMQPTWGVDAGAASLIHQALLDLAAEGAAVLVISQDLDEILTLADLVAVIAAGRLSEVAPVAQMTAERIGLLMGASHGEDHALAA